MKRAGKLLPIGVLFIIFAILVGCAPEIRNIEKGGMAQLQTPPIILKPGAKYIMVRFQDNTGRGLDCQAKIVSQIRNSGKKVVSGEKNSDDILTFIPYSFVYQKDLSRASSGGATIGALAGGIGAGLLTGFLTGSPAATGLAAAAGAAVGGYIGHQGDLRMAPGVITIKAKHRIDERINFIGEKQDALPEPIKKYRKVRRTTKSGKKIWVKELITEEESAETPIKSTSAVGRSGSSSVSVVTDRRVAKFIPYESDLVITYIVDHDTTWEEIKPKIEDQLAIIAAAPFK
jgi:hypothetical protein